MTIRQLMLTTFILIVFAGTMLFAVSCSDEKSAKKNAKEKDGIKMIDIEGGHHFIPYYDSREDVTIKDFQISATEITYKTWYDVKQWAIDDARGEKKYTFTNSKEKEGSQGEENAPPSENVLFPVTNVSLEDVLLWCNALSEKQGLEPVYYFDGEILRNQSILDDVVDDSSKLKDYGKQKRFYNYLSKKSDKDALMYVIDCKINKDAEIYFPDLFSVRLYDNRIKNGYRLPNSSEWEYAARGAVPTSKEWKYAYSGSDTATDVAWFRDECGWSAEKKQMGSENPDYGTKQVAAKKSNDFGLFDMSGNVSEWIFSGYVKINKYQDGLFFKYIYSSGAWDTEEKSIGIFTYADSKYRSASLGFRVVRTAD